jgi:flavin-dependent dehydrogenase
MEQHYDAIVVGGRCAGASTAMLLARGGLSVLVVEAARPGADTLSTHALMRGGVLQLHRWGMLDAVIAAGTPAITTTQFFYGDETETVEFDSRGGVSALYSPRRTVLDALLLDAARAAGAEIRMPAAVTGLLVDGASVVGVQGTDRGTGVPFRATASLTIGADGRNSTIARAVDTPVRRHGTASGAIVYRYVAGFPRNRYHWAYRPGVTAGVVPTGNGVACVWAGTDSVRFARQRSAGIDNVYRDLLSEVAPQLARAVAVAPPGRLRAYPGIPGWIRASSGRGWALVGDAAYFKDPITAHGMTDALRDAELLAGAVLQAPHAGVAQRAALGDYEHTRDRLSLPLFDITERIASYTWSLPELREQLKELSKAMRPEVGALLALDRQPVS